jgi:hypothetical protein
MNAGSLVGLGVVAAAIALGISCGAPDPPEYFGVYLWDGGDLVRLQTRSLRDLMRRDEFGAEVPIAPRVRADLLAYPVTGDTTPTLYVYQDNFSATSLEFRRFGLGADRPTAVYPLIKPVEDYENVYQVDFEPEQLRGIYEIVLPNDLVCGFEISPDK